MAYLGGIRRWTLLGRTPYVLQKIYRHSERTSGARPSIAGTLTLKVKTVFQSALEHAIFIQKLKILWPSGMEKLPPAQTHRRLRRLDPSAFGTQPFPLSKILNTPLRMMNRCFCFVELIC